MDNKVIEVTADDWADGAYYSMMKWLNPTNDHED